MTDSDRKTVSVSTPALAAEGSQRVSIQWEPSSLSRDLNNPFWFLFGDHTGIVSQLGFAIQTSGVELIVAEGGLSPDADTSPVAWERDQWAASLEPMINAACRGEVDLIAEALQRNIRGLQARDILSADVAIIMAEGGTFMISVVAQMVRKAQVSTSKYWEILALGKSLMELIWVMVKQNRIAQKDRENEVISRIIRINEEIEKAINPASDCR